MKKLAEFIVKNKVLFFVIFAALIVYAAISIPKVKVEYSIDEYLPDSTDTKQAIEIMDREFVTHGTAKIMIRNVTFERADALYREIKDLDGVKSFTFENTETYYRSSCALFQITFVGDEEDERAAAAYQEVRNVLDGCDLAVSTSPVNGYADELAKDMGLILILAAVVILLVLLFTSKSFAEIIVFPIVFVVAALLNMGTNYWLGKISFISNSVCVILQLALAIDYAIILCHRFTEEKERNANADQAMVAALSKAIPEIASSCLTTISGLLALTCMQLRLGADLGIVLSKSIVCSILTVFFLMPGVLLAISKWMDKSKHRSFVPRITWWGKAVLKIRYVLPVLFLAAAVTFGALQGNIDYVYAQNSIDTDRPTETMVAQAETQALFGADNMFVILLPKGDYARQRALLERVDAEPLVNSALGIANVKINDDTYLVDALGYRAFAELAEISYDSARAVYLFYAVNNGDYWAGLNDNLDDYAVPLIDMADFAFDLVDDGYFKPDEAQKEDFDALKDTLRDAEAQLIGDTYTRLVFNIDSSVESGETFALIERLLGEVKTDYPDAIFAGEAMSAYDLAHSFETDNLKITFLTIAFIFVILMFTFRSWRVPIIQVAVIQGAIFLNFGFVTLMGGNLFFFVYLIVSAIQMGATIDYAILITSRFRDLKKTMDKRQAVIEVINQAFPTIITSGCIMTVAALLIGFIVSDPLIASIGMCLGRGTIISVLCVMTVLPECLYLFSRILDKTDFKPRPSFLDQWKSKKKRIAVRTAANFAPRAACAQTSVTGEALTSEVLVGEREQNPQHTERAQMKRQAEQAIREARGADASSPGPDADPADEGTPPAEKDPAQPSGQESDSGGNTASGGEARPKRQTTKTEKDMPSCKNEKKDGGRR